MKQNNTKYHLLYIGLRDVDEFFPKEDRKEMLNLIKKLWQENQKLLKNNDVKGKYGISYKTIHDDSSYSDKHTQFFSTKTRRDDVYYDWTNCTAWDDIFDEEPPYRRPGENVHDIKKVFKEGNVIYEEIDCDCQDYDNGLVSNSCKVHNDNPIVIDKDF